MSVIINEYGIAIQDTSIILEEYRDIFRRIFGDNVDLTLQGVNGQFINELVLREVSNDTRMLELFNGFNIETARGVFLDYIGNLFGVKRRQPTSTVVNVTFTGLSGIIIPIGFTIQDQEGILYSTRTQGTINNGIINMDCYCQKLGSVEISSNSIRFFDNITGLDSVDN
ncbi:MAG: baseplate J/gp47 family protein, partial [Cetobacterium sp.]